MGWLDRTRGLNFDGYAELWQWSVTDLPAFWGAVWEYFDVLSETPPTEVVVSPVMPGARWFPGTRVNYAEHVLADARHR
jgi:acetoacetyl-CoA synthetase